MAIYLRDFDSGREHYFIGTLATVASHWNHVGATIDVQLQGDNFAAAPLEMSLASLVAPNGGFSGNGSRDAPIIVRVVTAGTVRSLGSLSRTESHWLICVLGIMIAHNVAATGVF